MEVEYNPWNVLSLEAFHFYNCPECEDKYSTKEQFTNHAIDVHPKARIIIPTMLDNNVNIVISEVQTSIKVEPNGEEFKPENAFDLDCHIKIEAIESDTENDSTELKQESSQSVTTEMHKCDQCPKSYSQKKQLKEHIRKVHDGLSHKCEHCGKSFSGERGLSMHIRSCHTTEPVTYKCDLCDKEYSHKHTLKSHKQSVHEGVTFKCDQCDKEFTRKNHLKEHIRDFHSGMKYKCDQCDKELFSLKGMALHKASNHPDETTKVYYCDSCPFTSLNQTSFRKHVKKYHN